MNGGIRPRNSVRHFMKPTVLVVMVMMPLVYRLPYLEMSDEQFMDAIQNGKGYMPAFPDLSDTDIENIIAFVRSL